MCKATILDKSICDTLVKHSFVAFFTSYMTGIIYSFALLAHENNVGRFISILRMQSTLNGGGKGGGFQNLQ